MTRISRKRTYKEVTVLKKTLFIAVIAMAIVALTALPAFAEGYNDPAEYTRDLGSFQGPHGGYTTTTNKCQECHSTHYATGKYMLLRANERAAACDFCHGGGGGSDINIMMDNDYRSGDFDVAQTSAETTTTMGYGTGHTLGYTGNAPTDINPAYSDPDGLACFSCHTPHGNSARVLTTFANPGRAFGGGSAVLPTTSTEYFGNSTDGVLDAAGEWGIDPNEGNIKIFSGGVVKAKPIWPTGRFLLLSNPHSDAAEGQNDMAVSDTADNGFNKLAISWDEPLGPADENYGGDQDADPDDSFPWQAEGFMGLNEFCTDCHDGAAGASTQSANVWKSDESTYTVASSHDSQPRH